MFGESVAGFDTEAFRVVVSSISWSLNERRVSGVAVTRHSVFVVPPVLVGTVYVDEKIDGPAVTVEFSRQIMLDDTTPAFREFLLDRLSPPDDRHHVRVIVDLKKRETLGIVEFPIKIDGLDGEETIPGEAQLALAEGTYPLDWSPATRQWRNSSGLNIYDSGIARRRVATWQIRSWR